MESTLKLRYGFYGLPACGWNITDFGERTIPARAASEAALAEAVVGLLDGERMTGQHYDVEGFNEGLAASRGMQSRTYERPVTNEELEEIRSLWRLLADRWAGVAPGDAMDITFEIPRGQQMLCPTAPRPASISEPIAPKAS